MSSAVSHLRRRGRHPAKRPDQLAQDTDSSVSSSSNGPYCGPPTPPPTQARRYYFRASTRATLMHVCALFYLTTAAALAVRGIVEQARDKASHPQPQRSQTAQSTQSCQWVVTLAAYPAVPLVFLWRVAMECVQPVKVVTMFLKWVVIPVVVWVGSLPSRCANQGVVVALATLPLVQRGICSLAICTSVLLLCARCGFAHCMSHD